MTSADRPHDRGAASALHVGVARFAGSHGAERAYADARDQDRDAAWLRDTAFVEVHRDGRIVARGSIAGRYVDIDGVADAMGPATGMGAVAGAAMGFLLGPPAFALGVTGGAAAGGVVEATHVPQQSGPAFEAIRREVPEGASALVVVSAPERVRAMSGALAAKAETFRHYRLSPAAEEQLRSMLAGASSAQPDPAPSP